MDNLSSEEIQQRAHQITDESLESTRRILGLAVEYWNMTGKMNSL
ncbi:SNAP23 isoform 20 [Pongo abelii]|uniref:SNAP23 isoform 12 n=1 Tax=Pongo abelii TaxID=9601 RepID=A0A2J8S5L2_PONAB|nr:SNAP23 isoform 12 [Pongo abelii]PNJ16050.1 SNAP23 isoform 20 [Pongo abelii]